MNDTTEMQADHLNQKYAIPQQLSFEAGTQEKAGFTFIQINNDFADALISVYGGQVLSFQPKSSKNESDDVLFASDTAVYQPGKAIKGGIPICWPWFGDDPEALGRAAHGFVRNRLWSVEKTATLANGETQVVLGLKDNSETQSIWPYVFNLSLTVTIGKTLQLELKTQNTGDKPFVITQALHSYFLVGDIHETRVTGLQDIDYIDKTLPSLPCIKQHGAVIIDKEVDRIYLKAPSETKLVDDALKRIVTITSHGSHTTVVWNPWVESTAQMADLPNDSYLHFLCVETANAANDEVVIAPDESFCLHMEVAIA